MSLYQECLNNLYLRSFWEIRKKSLRSLDFWTYCWQAHKIQYKIQPVLKLRLTLKLIIQIIMSKTHIDTVTRAHGSHNATTSHSHLQLHELMEATTRPRHIPTCSYTSSWKTQRAHVTFPPAVTRAHGSHNASTSHAHSYTSSQHVT